MSLEPVGGISRTADRKATLQATFLEPSNGDGSERSRTLPFSFAATGATNLTLDLKPGRWRLKLVSSDFWGPAKELDVRAVQGASMSVWELRTAKLVLTGVKDGARIGLQFRGPDGVPEALRVPASSTACTLTLGSCVARLPRQRLDLRIATAGFIPEYLWNVPSGPDFNRSLRMEVGASVSGYVKKEPGSAAKSVAMELLTMQGESIRGSSRDEDRLPFSTEANSAGFFQIRAVPPGEYRLAASHPSGMGMTVVTVVANEETRVDDYLTLEPPMQLSVSVEPAVPPRGDSWTIKVIRLSPLQAKILETAMDVNGVISLGPLFRGRYVIELWSDSSKWVNEVVQIEQPPGPLVIKVPTIAVQGSLAFGDEPISGEVTFGGLNGPRHVAMSADSEGVFEGILPSSGDWVVDVRSPDAGISRVFRKVRVEADSSGTASVKLRVPKTALMGRVVNGKGEAVSSALVSINPYGVDDAPLQLTTSAAGTFEARGLGAGRYSAWASAMEERSNPLTFSISEGPPTAITLTTETPGVVSGSVVDENGLGIPGATIQAFGIGPVIGSPRVVANQRGEFTLRFGSSIQEANVIYWADGRALHVQRARLTSPLRLVATGATGTLSLDFGRDVLLVGAPDGSFPVLVSGGGEAHAAAVASYSMRRGAMLSPGGATQRTLTIPGMAPGPYALCWQTTEGMARDLRPQGCVQGTLVPGGELPLKFPIQ